MVNHNQPEPDYKEMYLKLFRASEAAINFLIAAQQECEEMYLCATGTQAQQAENEK